MVNDALGEETVVVVVAAVAFIEVQVISSVLFAIVVMGVVAVVEVRVVAVVVVEGFFLVTFGF